MADAQPAPSVGNEHKYGGAEGAEAMYVKLVSSDDHEFYVRREYALTSGTIKAMLSGPGILRISSAVFFRFSKILCLCRFFRRASRMSVANGDSLHLRGEKEPATVTLKNCRCWGSHKV